jgi:UDP-GlcNAc:undecaprenyl-phosphate GlcNAc-1-phosphate transferase
MLGSLAMIGSYTPRNQVGILTPIIILGVPIFDMAFVSYIRWRRGMRIVLGSPDHFALRLRKWRLSTTQTVLCSYALTGLLGASGLIMIHASNLGAVLVLLLVCGAGWGLGYFLKKIDMTM